MSEVLLKQVPIFATLPVDEIRQLASGLHPRSYPAGSLLFQEGDRGDCFYIVLSGSIAIIKALDSPHERLVAVRGPGEFVGEMSLLLEDHLRSASARVHEQALLLELTQAQFESLLEHYPSIAQAMLQVVMARLRQAHNGAIRDLTEKNERLARAYAELQAAQAQLIEQEALAHELRLARQIQRNMLPRSLPVLPNVDLGACMIPARMVGGDFYDMFLLSPQALGVVIGDVSGKGVPAALFMALAQSLLRAEASRASSPEQAVQSLNRLLIERNGASMFVTLIYCVLDAGTGECVLVRAGHEPALILDPAGERIELPWGVGQPLGLLPHVALDVQRFTLPAGALMLLYTDGITEAMDSEDNFFGDQRLCGTVRESRALVAQAVCDLLSQAALDYQDAGVQHDDITVVAVSRQPDLQP